MAARLRERARSFRKFMYDKETNEILGRTCKGWGEIGLFFLVFYSILAAILAIHLTIFLAVTPLPMVGQPPWIYGRYAYMNYPNSKIELTLTPRRFSFKKESGQAELSNFDFNYMGRLHSGASASGVDEQCLDGNTRFGFYTRQPCLYLHIARVFNWTPELINSTLQDSAELPFNCTFEAEDITLSLPLIIQPGGLPLNIDNNADSRSYPFINQPNYKTPVLALILNLTTLPPNLPDRFDASIMCSLDFDAIGMAKPSDRLLSRLYEIPSDAITTIRFQQ